jgi:hypothetical protein
MTTLAPAAYREVLRDLDDWDAYLVEHSHLPGPRANLSLLKAVGDQASASRLFALADSPDEFQAACGAAGLGRLVVEGDRGVAALVVAALQRMRELADDPRWRVREGVAMGLQRIGDADTAQLGEILHDWSTGSPLCRRAVVAGICEPRLLTDPMVAEWAIGLLAGITASLLAEPDRLDPDVRVLRQSLGYGWSVAIVAAPASGKAAFERLAALDDPDARWIVRENLGKARLGRLDSAWVAALRARP